MAKSISLAGIMVLTGIMTSPVFAQNSGTSLDGRVGTITTAVPFLRISPDARSGAMGDVGLALSPDANAQYWNVAKLAASKKDMGASITYTPWLKDLVPDVFLGYVSGYKKFGPDGGNQAISASLRYFNLGDLDYRDESGLPNGTGKPREFSFDIGYSRNLSENLSVGVALRYINSNIAAGSVSQGSQYKPANAVAGDIGLYYHKTNEMSEDQAGTISFGAVLSNLGSKISYSQQNRDFIPTNLGIGGAYSYKVDKYNQVTFALDLNKALTPAPVQKTNSSTGELEWEIPNMGVLAGIGNSFLKAPPGYGTTISVGGEYWYQEQFAVRAGYFYENKNNGDRQYFTCGLGVKYNVFGLNFAYLVPSGSGVARNPLSNTLRFSLTFDFDKGALGKNAASSAEG